MKAKPEIRRYIQSGRVSFWCVVGVTLIYVQTDVDNNDWPEKPPYMNVSFFIPTPSKQAGIKKAVLAAIKKKVADQRRKGLSAKLPIKSAVKLPKKKSTVLNSSFTWE